MVLPRWKQRHVFSRSNFLLMDLLPRFFALTLGAWNTITGQTDIATLSAEVTPSNGVQSTVGEVSSIVESVSTSSRSLSVGSVSAEMTRFEEVQSSSANSQSPSMTPNPTVTATEGGVSSTEISTSNITQTSVVQESSSIVESVRPSSSSFSVGSVSTETTSVDRVQSSSMEFLSSSMMPSSLSSTSMMPSPSPAGCDPACVMGTCTDELVCDCLEGWTGEDCGTVLLAPAIITTESMVRGFSVGWNFTDNCSSVSFELRVSIPVTETTPFALVSSLQTTRSSAVVRDLESDTEYCVEVKGHCGRDSSTFSNPSCIRTAPQPSLNESYIVVEQLVAGTGEPTLTNGITVAINDVLKDQSSYFGHIYGYYLSFAVSILNSRRLLPFGTVYGDEEYSFTYDRYYYYDRYYGVRYTLRDELPFFGSEHRILYLNFYGFVSVGRAYSNPWRRVPFPLTGGVPMVAAMWWWYHSTIYVHEYRVDSGQEYDEAIITLVRNRLQRYHGVSLDFSPETVVSVTWSLDYRYIGYTAQMLLVSDGVMTYSILCYDEDNWNFPYWYSRYSWYRYSGPVIGYSGGDGFNFKTLDVEYWNLNNIAGNTGVVGVWVFPIFSENNEIDSQLRCKAWYDREKLHRPVDFVRESSLNACPCTIRQAERNWRMGWAWGFRYGSRERCTVMWWPRRNNRRWWWSRPIGSKECCYDERGNLLVGPKLGGTSNRYHHYYETTKHINNDLAPYRDCCVGTSKTKFCNYYYELRVSDDCSEYDERTARFWGDPHFNTFDGLGYTFNGKGEFWLVRTTDDSVSIQVRLSPFGSGAATVITAAVVQFNSTASANAYIDNNGVIVEIGGQTFAIEDVPSATYVGQDGTVYEVDMMSSDSFSQLENVSFILDNDTNTAGGISISPTDGSLSVTVRLQSSDVLSVTTDLNAAVVRGKTRGLLGVINGNTSDDFTLPNGTITDVNATNQREVYYQFGLLWRVSEMDSLFVYRGSDSYASVNNDTGFTPQFDLDFDNIPPNIRVACAGDVRCLFDFQETNDTDLAMSTAQEQDSLQETRTTLVAPPTINGPRQIRVVAGQMYMAQYNSTGNLSLQSPSPPNLSLVDDVLSWNTPPSLAPNDTIQILATLSDCNTTNSLMVSVVLCGCVNGGECIETSTPNFGSSSYYQEQCRCSPAYEGMLCEIDMNGCTENPCQDPSFCEDVPAPGVGFNCTGCLEGYQLNGTMCDDIDECSQDEVCQPHSTCENSPGSFVCVCEEGYLLQDQDCVDVDECMDGSAQCQQVCVNNEGSYQCSCLSGFIQDPASGACSASEPCTLQCGAGTCATVDGISQCVCPSGMQSNGSTCVGCSRNTFGFNCSMVCNCMNGGQCNSTTGCECSSRWTGGNCTIEINNFSPEFSSTLQTMFSISDRAITGTVITKLTATDKDGDSIEYSLLEFQSSTMYQDGRPFFLVNSNTGNVTIQNQPDGSGPYLLTVVASDNGAEPRQSSPFYLVITVTSKFDRVILLHISESDAVGTRVSGVQCSENTTSVQVLDDSEVENIFDLSNIQSGYVKLATEVDYEEKQVYTFDVECMERNEGPINASIKIAVLDVNDHDPWLSSSDAAPSSSLNVMENNPVGQVIGHVNYSDPDSSENGNVTFILNPSEVPVTINSKGEIVMSLSVNFEVKQQHTFTVMAVDGGVPQRSSTVLSFTLQVENVDDPPVFSGLAYVAHMPDFAVLPSSFLTLSVGDDDDPSSVSLSTSIPWVSASFGTQMVSLSTYPTEETVRVGSAQYLATAAIFPFLDGNQNAFDSSSGQPVYLKGMLTASSNIDVTVPLYIVVFPRESLIKVSVTTTKSLPAFRTTADTMATVFTTSLKQHTITSGTDYKFEIFTMQKTGDKIDMYGYFHNGTQKGALTRSFLRHNYHFLTQNVTKNILADGYTQSQVAAALGNNIKYSVEGAEVTPNDQPVLDTWIIATIAAGVAVAILVFFVIGLALGCCLRRRHKAKVHIARTFEPDTMMLWEK